MILLLCIQCKSFAKLGKTQEAVVDALVTALSMDPKTRDANFQRDHSYVASQTLGKWLNQNLAELKREGREKVGPVRGLGADFRMLIMERGHTLFSSIANSLPFSGLALFSTFLFVFIAIFSLCVSFSLCCCGG